MASKIDQPNFFSVLFKYCDTVCMNYSRRSVNYDCMRASAPVLSSSVLELVAAAAAGVLRIESST